MSSFRCSDERTIIALFVQCARDLFSQVRRFGLPRRESLRVDADAAVPRGGFARDAVGGRLPRRAAVAARARPHGRSSRQFIIERRERLKAATRYVLRLFANQTLPRPPDPQAKCYLSGADDIRPALFRALPC